VKLRAIKILFILSCIVLPLQLLAEPIRIGATLALTGDGATWGTNAARGIQLAVENVNEHGGISGNSLEVVFEDYRSSDYKLAASAAKKFISIDNVRAILTQWAGDTEVVWPIASKAGVVTICIGPGTVDSTKSQPLVFRIWPPEASLIKASVDYAFSKGAKKAAVVKGVESHFLKATELTKSYWKKRVGVDVFVQEIQQRETDLRGIALNLKRNNPDVIFLHMSYDLEGVMINRLREIGVQALVVGEEHSDDPAILSVAGKNAEGVVYPQFAVAETPFRAQFRSKFRAEPVDPAEYAYDSIMILAESLRDARTSSGHALSNAILKMKNFEGSSGLINFDASGNRKEKTVEIRIIKNGKGEPT
jgi:branched-chain amino acid transport system substrate-binding protein